MATTLAPTSVHPPSCEIAETPSEPKEPEPSGAPSCVLQQRPVSVTLDGPSMFALALALVLLIHFLGSPPAEILVGLTPVFLLIRNDYRNFIRLGPGGTPSTPAGYLRISWLRLWALRDPFSAPPRRPDPDPDSGPARRIPRHGILAGAAQAGLPYRPGPRPLVAGIAPQRQLDQHGSRDCYRALRRAMEHLAARFPPKFGTERSCLEKHGLALFARHPLRTNCQGEVCHVHDSDHSMHMCLHPDDIREILTKGWGQRHPLARSAPFLRMPVSQDFVMVYAPRNEQELHIIYRIIEAAIWYILAESVKLGACPKPPQSTGERTGAA